MPPAGVGEPAGSFPVAPSAAASGPKSPGRSGRTALRWTACRLPGGRARWLPAWWEELPGKVGAGKPRDRKSPSALGTSGGDGKSPGLLSKEAATEQEFPFRSHRPADTVRRTLAHPECLRFGAISISRAHTGPSAEAGFLCGFQGAGASGLPRLDCGPEPLHLQHHRPPTLSPAARRRARRALHAHPAP